MLIAVDRLLALVTDIFAAAGCAPEEARRVAEGLVDANLTGHDSHGVVRVPRYVEWLEAGEVEAGRSIAVLSEAGALAVVDGQYGFGATVGRQAVEFGIRRALDQGTAIVALRHAGHLGRIGQWAELALEHGLVSIHFVNVAGSVLVAPFGSVDRRFSTAPIAFGFPLEGEPPVVLDFATSAVAEGKVLVAANGGKPVPPGSLIDPDGRLSTDPATLYGPLEETAERDHRKGAGAIRAMGEHKGSGLALMCELLGGVLAGSGTSGPEKHRFANGMVSIYMAPSAFGRKEDMVREARKFVAWLRSSRPAVAGEAVMLPGDPERRTREERQAAGIPVAPGAWAAIRATAERLGVTI
ncbi:malate/lactate/ureidoglycolate dehydrogenase [Enterovirga aerilata]|uniref:Malate/lactate/ureidoglycolate dehydrogenase n=1 Tax=Enterovirga aerilata TaxID=2730920 RepID=A0A849IAC6_9HYPH|nr:malate/lactate/ureidoglycolate dehydrogenase [Enterovirga sp. DB1703]NNM70913.1 malate/lactate/ureidoglycolate dehydrogenase [Enterovirga sp. DB1703]